MFVFVLFLEPVSSKPGFMFQLNLLLPLVDVRVHFDAALCTGSIQIPEY